MLWILSAQCPLQIEDHDFVGASLSMSREGTALPAADVPEPAEVAAIDPELPLMQLPPSPPLRFPWQIVLAKFALASRSGKASLAI